MKPFKNVSMKQFIELMHNVSGGLMLFGQTLISAFFVIVILAMVLVVEIQRVAHGIELFEASEKSAYLGAFVLVTMLLTLEFVIHYVETKQGYHEEQKSEFSLRLFYHRLLYFIGWQDKEKGITWQARLKSPAQQIKSYSRLLTMTILALALGGSMADTISAVDGNWIQGMKAIALDSSLLEIVRWSGGLLFALALVIGAQRLTAYVAQRASETLIQSSQEPVTNDYKKEKDDYLKTGILPEYDQTRLPIDSLVLEPLNEQDTEPVEPVADNFILDWKVEAHDIPYHVETCEHCDWSTDPKPELVNAKRAMATHKKHHCPVLNPHLVTPEEVQDKVQS